MSRKIRLSNLKVRRISLVDDGDNPHARVLLAKRRDDGSNEMTLAERFHQAIEACRKALGRAPNDQLRAQIYSDLIEGGDPGVTGEALETLAKSAHSTLFFPEDEDETEVRDELALTIKGLLGELEDDEPVALADALMKRFKESKKAPPDLDEFQKALGEEVEELLKPHPGKGRRGKKPVDRMKEKTMEIDLSTLSDDQRAKLKELVAKAKNADELEAKLAALTKKDEPKEPSLEDLIKKLPDNVLPVVQALQKVHSTEMQTLTKKYEDLVGERERETLEKSLKLPNLSLNAAELSKVLKDVDEKVRTTLVGVLSAANEAVGKAGDITKAFGVNVVPGAASTVEQEVDAAVTELRKVKPDLTPEQARAAVWEANPALYDRYIAETTRPN